MVKMVVNDWLNQGLDEVFGWVLLTDPSGHHYTGGEVGVGVGGGRGVGVGGGWEGRDVGFNFSICPSICRRNSFQEINLVCCRILISNFENNVKSNKSIIWGIPHLDWITGKLQCLMDSHEEISIFF